MAKMGWAKFWFRDYESDIDVRMCSFAAQGLWMRLLCHMHEGTPRGYLTRHGVTVPDDTLPQLVCGRDDEVKKLLKELEDNGVFDRDANGTIFCRRMVREGERSEIYTKNGRRGGNPSLSKAKLKGKNHDDSASAEKPNSQANRLTKKDEIGLPSRSSRSLEDSIPKATPSGPAEPAPAVVPDVRSELWQEGLAILQGLTGKGEKSCRTFLGKLLQEAKDDCARVLEALREASKLRPADPPAWLKAALTPRLSREMDAKAAALVRLGGVDVIAKTHNDVPGPVIDESGKTIHEHA